VFTKPKKSLALTFADSSTGELNHIVYEGKSALYQAENEIYKYSPAEILLNKEAYDSDLTGYIKAKLSCVFEVVDKEGNKTQTTIDTNGEYVGLVLQELGLIEGEQGAYGIYIKKVNGITADYDVDGTYWAFYVDGEMSMKGADQVEIVDGATYSFRAEK
jgi:DNA mismatch repair ATPase MutS